MILSLSQPWGSPLEGHLIVLVSCTMCETASQAVFDDKAQ